MFVFAIETCGKTVAFTKETDRLMLAALLEGRDLRDSLLIMQDSTGKLWDGASPFTARLATESEEFDYDITAHEYLEREPDVRTDESILMFSFINDRGENVLVIPPTMANAPH